MDDKNILNDINSKIDEMKKNMQEIVTEAMIQTQLIDDDFTSSRISMEERDAKLTELTKDTALQVKNIAEVFDEHICQTYDVAESSGKISSDTADFGKSRASLAEREIKLKAISQQKEMAASLKGELESNHKEHRENLKEIKKKTAELNKLMTMNGYDSNKREALLGRINELSVNIEKYDKTVDSYEKLKNYINENEQEYKTTYGFTSRTAEITQTFIDGFKDKLTSAVAALEYQLDTGFKGIKDHIAFRSEMNKGMDDIVSKSISLNTLKTEKDSLLGMRAEYKDQIEVNTRTIENTKAQLEILKADLENEAQKQARREILPMALRNVVHAIKGEAQEHPAEDGNPSKDSRSMLKIKEQIASLETDIKSLESENMIFAEKIESYNKELHAVNKDIDTVTKGLNQAWESRDAAITDRACQLMEKNSLFKKFISAAERSAIEAQERKSYEKIDAKDGPYGKTTGRLNAQNEIKKIKAQSAEKKEEARAVRKQERKSAKSYNNDAR